MPSSNTPVGQARQVIRYIWDHPANHRIRVRALTRALRFQLRGRLGRRTVVPLGDRMKLWGVLHHAASSKVAYANPPDFAEMLAWRSVLRHGGLFVDIGANLGAYTIWALDSGADAVIAVEPGNEALGQLRANIQLNELEHLVEVHESVLADRVGDFFITTDLDSTNHLVEEGRGQPVVATTLDQVLADRIATGVKIDVEGAERLVLEGGRRALREGRLRVMQLEWNRSSERVLGESREPIVELLTGHGYRFFRPDQSGSLHPASPDEFGPDIFAVLRG